MLPSLILEYDKIGYDAGSITHDENNRLNFIFSFPSYHASISKN